MKSRLKNGTTNGPAGDREVAGFGAEVVSRVRSTADFPFQIMLIVLPYRRLGWLLDLE